MGLRFRVYQTMTPNHDGVDRYVLTGVCTSGTRRCSTTVSTGCTCRSVRSLETTSDDDALLTDNDNNDTKV